MDKEKKTKIEREIIDAILERPYGFTAGRKHFILYPISLGKSLLISNLLANLNIDPKTLKINPALEAFRVTTNNRELVCRIIAYCICNTKEEIFNEKYIKTTTKYFLKKISDQDIATLFLIICSFDRTSEYIKHLGLDKEQEDQRRISKIKNKDGGTVCFGGKSLYGSLIGTVCEKYGWTYEYVMWGISLINLKMLLADSVNTIYLTEKERKEARISVDKERLSADNPKNWAKIKSMNWN